MERACVELLDAEECRERSDLLLNDLFNRINETRQDA